MRKCSVLACVLPALAASLPAYAQRPAAAVSFAPHRAVYDMKLDRALPGSGVEEMSGRMVYELTGSACEGYTQNMRFVTRMVNKDGAAQVNDLRSSSFEAADASRLRFNTSQHKDDRILEATQGDAARDGRGVEVDLVKPAPKKLTLAAGVYFPIQHSMAIIDAARAGKTALSVPLYDGGDKGEKVYGTNAVIGRKGAPGAVKQPASLKEGGKLDALASWPLSISYFEPGAEKVDAVPSYELGFRFYENGVSSDLRIDYGEFAIRGDLTELTFLEPAKCETR